MTREKTVRAWRSFLSVFRRELGLIISDRNIVSIIILAPFFYAFFYSTIYMNKSEQDVPIAVVNMDNTDVSRQIERRLDAHQLIRLAWRLPDLSEARRLIDSQDIYGVVFIPKDFGNHLAENRGTTIKVYLNTTRFLVSNDINKAINDVIQSASSQQRIAWLRTKGFNSETAEIQADPVLPDIRSVFNVSDSYGDFMIPGLLMLILQQTLLFGLGLSAAKERESGKIGEWAGQAGNMLTPMIHGKIAFYVALYGAYAFAFFGAIFAIFSVSFSGSVVAALALTAIYLVAIAYFALFVASFFRTKLVAFQMLVFTSYPSFLLSGLSWPIGALPLPLQILAESLPGTPFMRAMMRVSQMGAGIGDILPELAQLTLLLAVYGFAMRWRWLRLLERETLIVDGADMPDRPTRRGPRTNRN